MAPDPEPIQQLSRALDQTEEIISRTRPEQSSLPTPCASWDVRALVNHVVHDIRQFTGMASGGRYERSDADVIGDDWIGAYRQAAEGLLEAWRRQGSLDRKIQLPFGEVTATWSIGQQVADLVVHGWDIAKATGHPTDLDADLGQFALDWGKENLKPQFRGDEDSGKSFGPEVRVADDAPLYERMAAFWGRDPN